MTAKLEMYLLQADLWWTRFISENRLRLCFFEDGSDEWWDLKIRYEDDGKLMIVEEEHFGISNKYLGSSNNSFFMSSNGDCIAVDSTIPNLKAGVENAPVLAHENSIGLIGDQNFDGVLGELVSYDYIPKFATILGDSVVFIISDKVVFYGKFRAGKSFGKQWILEVQSEPLGFFSDECFLFILYRDRFLKICLK
jgi:hypothetical protein